MSREGFGLLRFVSSDDGTRCAAECPHRNTPTDTLCLAYRVNGSPTNIKRGRSPACIAAEQAAASVPSCEWHGPGCSGVPYHHPNAPHLDGGARALDASEALREARVQGMREAMDIVRVNACVDSARSDIWRAIEAVRKGE